MEDKVTVSDNILPSSHDAGGCACAQFHCFTSTKSTSVSELLEEYETEHGDLVLHNEVRWLSRGRVLERFSSLLPQICEFLKSKGKSQPELENPEWIMKLALLTDITCHLNSLNLQLQGQNKHPGSMLRVVTAFQNKITRLFIPDRQMCSLSKAQNNHHK